MKVYLIESWYVQLCMVHISQNTQGIRKITVSVEIIPSQIIWVKAKNFLQLLNRFKYYRVLAFVFNIFCNIILLFYFLNWSFGIRISGKSCMIFLSPVLQWVAYICLSFQLDSSVRKTILYCDWISEFSLGRR